MIFRNVVFWLFRTRDPQPTARHAMAKSHRLSAPSNHARIAEPQWKATIHLKAVMIIGLSVISSIAMANSPGDAIVENLVEQGHRQVGVIPTVIARRDTRESTVGALGPRGLLMANEVYENLIDSSQSGRHQGKFRVIAESEMRRAMSSENFTVNALSDPAKIRDLAKEAGADALVVLTHDENADEFEFDLKSADSGRRDETERAVSDRITAETIDQAGFATSTQNFEEDRTLSKAAYSGESWWIRRWEKGELINMGIDLEGTLPFGKGDRWENLHYKTLKPHLDHPYNKSDFPYRLDVIVNGETRNPHVVPGVHGTQLVVALDPGEEYAIALENDHDEGVFCALYIDGICTIDKLRAEPGDLETFRHWYLKGKSGPTRVSGWYTIQRDSSGNRKGSPFFNKFRIVSREDSEAFGQAFGKNIGMITAVFYTNGMGGISQPSEEDRAQVESRGLANADFGTGLGSRRDQKLEFSGDQERGIILASYTLYYRTHDQIAGLRSGHSESDLPLLPKKGAMPPASGFGKNERALGNDRVSESTLPK